MFSVTVVMQLKLLKMTSRDMSGDALLVAPQQVAGSYARPSC